MSAPIILDTGPLVALLDRHDRYHEWSKRQVAEQSAPLCTCEAVFSETLFLVRHIPHGVENLCSLFARGLVTAPFRLDEQKETIAQLLLKYADVPMSLADACLVRMAEQHARSVILTCDSDFQIYRKHGKQTLSVLMP